MTAQKVNPTEVIGTIFTEEMIRRTKDTPLAGWSLNDLNNGFYAVMKVVGEIYAHSERTLVISNTDYGISCDVTIKPGTNSRVFVMVTSPLDYLNTQDCECTNEAALQKLILLAERICASALGASDNIMGTVPTDSDEESIIDIDPTLD